MNTTLLRRSGPVLAALILAGACLVLVTPEPALAQQDDGLRPPTPRSAENVPILSYVAALVVIVAPLAVNFISSKRGHQD